MAVEEFEPYTIEFCMEQIEDSFKQENKIELEIEVLRMQFNSHAKEGTLKDLAHRTAECVKEKARQIREREFWATQILRLERI